MWGRVCGCAVLAAGVSAGAFSSAAIGGVIVVPPVLTPDHSAQITGRLDTDAFVRPPSPWQVAPPLPAIPIVASPLAIIPTAQRARAAQTPLEPLDIPSSATLVRRFTLLARLSAAPSPFQAIRSFAGVIPPPELPGADAAAVDLFESRSQARSGIVEFFTVPSPAGVLVLIPPALMANRRRRSR